ncbi:MAG: hypothetical protein HKM07_04865 [Chlamydiae bacterium]|nr:hypothetical protein [Chlamydiota bacterium]
MMKVSGEVSSLVEAYSPRLQTSESLKEILSLLQTLKERFPTSQDRKGLEGRIEMSPTSGNDFSSNPQNEFDIQGNTRIAMPFYIGTKGPVDLPQKLAVTDLVNSYARDGDVILVEGVPSNKPIERLEDAPVYISELTSDVTIVGWDDKEAFSAVSKLKITERETLESFLAFAEEVGSFTGEHFSIEEIDDPAQFISRIQSLLKGVIDNNRGFSNLKLFKLILENVKNVTGWVSKLSETRTKINQLNQKRIHSLFQATTKAILTMHKNIAVGSPLNRMFVIGGSSEIKLIQAEMKKLLKEGDAAAYAYYKGSSSFILQSKL